MGQSAAAALTAATYSDGLWRALASLEGVGVPSAVAERALKTWNTVSRLDPPEPCIERVNEAVRFTWSGAEVYLHLDVLDAGVEWFFEDNRTKMADGTRGAPEREIPSAFFMRLEEVNRRL